MSDQLYNKLSRREHQIMNIVFEVGEATAAEIVARLPEPSSNSSIRILLGILEEKGYLTHRNEGARFVYRATIPQETAKRSALANLVKIFFGGSVTQVVAALLDDPNLSEAEQTELQRLIAERKREEGGEE